VFASPEGARTIDEIDDPAHGPLRLIADPIRIDGERLPTRLAPPALGADTEAVLAPDDGER
jgi:crotonobetainyl-CoA:carnitine CoA-transferase CaiB-like acyl-CoA transferase